MPAKLCGDGPSLAAELPSPQLTACRLARPALPPVVALGWSENHPTIVGSPVEESWTAAGERPATDHAVDRLVLGIWQKLQKLANKGQQRAIQLPCQLE